MAFRASQSYTSVETVVAAFQKRPIVAMVNDSKFDGAGYVPYTLSITDPESVYDLYAGSLVLSIVIDPARMEAVSDALGHRVETDADSNQPLTVYRRTCGAEHGVRVGRHTFRIFTEFVSPS